MTPDELMALETGELVVANARSEIDNSDERPAYVSSMEAYAGKVCMADGEKADFRPHVNCAAIRLKDENGNRLPYWWYSSFIDKYVDISAFKEEASDEELEAMLSGF